MRVSKVVGSLSTPTRAYEIHVEATGLNILSIQSSVAYGHVGNSAAVFPLQRMGFEVWPVNTVHFSNHTGYGEWRGPVLPAEDVAGVVPGIKKRGVVPPLGPLLSRHHGGAPPRGG